MLSIEMSIISYQTQKTPWISSPVTATGADTCLYRDYWHHYFILSETVRGNMTKNKSTVKPENKLVVA
jgi:hypothetical protein